MTLIWPLNKGHHSFWYQSISHTRYRLSIRQLVNFCSMTHRLATIHSVLQMTDRRNPAAIVVKFKNIIIKFVKFTLASQSRSSRRRPVDVGIRYARSFQCCQRDLVTVNLNNVPDCIAHASLLRFLECMNSNVDQFLSHDPAESWTIWSLFYLS